MGKWLKTVFPSQGNGPLSGRLADKDRWGRLKLLVDDVARAEASVRYAKDELDRELAAATRQGQDELVAAALADLESRRVRS
jgi:hypothetical protein